MAVIIDLTDAEEAFGEETSYYAGTIRVDSWVRIIDGASDRDGYSWVDMVMEQLIPLLGLPEDYAELVEEGDESTSFRLGCEISLGSKYTAENVNGKLVVTEITPPPTKQYVFVFENAEPTLNIEGFSTKTSFTVDAPDLKTAVAALAAWGHATLDWSEYPDNYTDDIDGGNISVYVPAKKDGA